jgi:hypothetical protein
VPQIARNLQTEPVTVPLPPNNGVAGSYTAHISGWSLELLNAESAAVIAEYSARQEALRKKMEEEAAAAARPAGEVPSPTPGGDPVISGLLFSEELYEMSLAFYHTARDANYLEKAADAVELAYGTPLFKGKLGSYAKSVEKFAHEIWLWAVRAQREEETVLYNAAWYIQTAGYEGLGRFAPTVL